MRKLETWWIWIHPLTKSSGWLGANTSTLESLEWGGGGVSGSLWCRVGCSIGEHWELVGRMAGLGDSLACAVYQAGQSCV